MVDFGLASFEDDVPYIFSKCGNIFKFFYFIL